ncbi:hypothetical protein DQP57_10175 [Mycobacterium colombiense]|uniref:Uncharacterized protein n=1 Tax=Mycobacterium colombiense TaxID=339268 RepID=A0A329LX50_9MYCO|nr:hypothetical protein DQP57_10175 [Mycobacterium colombiense]
MPVLHSGISPVRTYQPTGRLAGTAGVTSRIPLRGRAARGAISGWRSAGGRPFWPRAGQRLS